MKKDDKKNLALVFGITSNYVFALANTLIGLVNHNKKFWDDIIVYYDSMDELDIEAINKIVECKFICAKDLKFAKNLPSELIKEYSVATFYRYECFNLLNEYHKVIWNDVDILIQGDISGLCEYGDKSGFCLTLNTVGVNVEANFKKLIPEYNMFTLLYNAGILVVSDILPNYEKSYDWLIDTTCKYADILRWGDQGILNLFIQEFNINVEDIDIDKYCCHPNLVSKNDDVAIIHAYGREKFWNCDEYKIMFPEWVENEQKWWSIQETISRSSQIDESKPLVSCIMSIYDRMDFADESIRSILNQTYSNLELIIVIEKSPNQDKIEKELLKYKDKRLVLIKNDTRLGFPASLNVAMDAAKGKYIARMDDDDISLPNRFAKQVEYMEKHPNVGISGTNGVFFGAYNTEIGVETDPDLLKIITMFRTPFIHPTVIMNKKMMDDNNLRYSTEYFTEDYELWSRAVKYFDIANLPDILLRYRSGNVKLTSSSNNAKIQKSHEKIVHNQIKDYLGMDFTPNEVGVVQQRLGVLDVCYNYEETVRLREDTYNKIINANKKVKFYNQSKLIKYLKQKSEFETSTVHQNIVKRGVKMVIKPAYSRLMARVSHEVHNETADIYEYVNKKCDNILKEIKKNEK